MTQQSNCWGYTPRKPELKETRLPHCSSQYCLQYPTWKQHRCPLADEWIRNLWYIYTMNYYSAIEKNAFESVLKRWMKMEPINSWVIFHCVYLPQLSYPFVCWWTFRLLPCPVYYKLVQPPWRTVWRFFKKLEIELSYDPEMPLLGIHTKETRIERDTCTSMFIAALF